MNPLNDFELLKIWNKAMPIVGSPNHLRKDVLGNIIAFNEYGNRMSKLGWEADHIVPKAEGGTDDLSNLRPLQWEANVLRSSSEGIIGHLSSQ